MLWWRRVALPEQVQSLRGTRRVVQRKVHPRLLNKRHLQRHQQREWCSDALSEHSSSQGRHLLLAATVEIEEIVREPTPPPQLLRTVIQHGEEFEMLEEVEASMETKKLRADLTSMIGRIEVSMKRSSLSFK